METIITATGKQIQVDSVSAIPDPQILYIRVAESDISKVASIFSNPLETEEIHYGNYIFRGYTTLSAIISENGLFRVNLKRS